MPLNPTQPGMAAGRCSGWRQGYYGRSATLAVAPHAGLLALALEQARGGGVFAELSPWSSEISS